MRLHLGLQDRGVIVHVLEATGQLVKEFVQQSIVAYGVSSIVSDLQHASWKHLNSPDGRSLVIGSSRNGNWSRMWVQQRAWKYRGETLVAQNPVDLVIYQSEPSPISFLTLWKTTARECNRNGDIWYHTSNPNSERLYSDFLHLKPSLNMTGLVHPLQSSSLIREAYAIRSGGVNDSSDLLDYQPSGDLKISRRENFRIRLLDLEEAEDLVDSKVNVISETALVGHRNFRWRFSQDSHVRYLCLGHFGKDGAVVVTVWRLVTKGDLKVAVLVDLVGDRLVRFDWLRVWWSFRKLWLHQDCDLMMAFANTENSQLARAFGFPWIRVPRRFLPQEIPVYFHGSRAQDLPVGAAYMTLYDFDIL
jgi:hypothetical protein